MQKCLCKHSRPNWVPRVSQLGAGRRRTRSSRSVVGAEAHGSCWFRRGPRHHRLIQCPSGATATPSTVGAMNFANSSRLDVEATFAEGASVSLAGHNDYLWPVASTLHFAALSHCSNSELTPTIRVLYANLSTQAILFNSLSLIFLSLDPCTPNLCLLFFYFSVEWLLKYLYPFQLLDLSVHYSTVCTLWKSILISPRFWINL